MREVTETINNRLYWVLWRKVMFEPIHTKYTITQEKLLFPVLNTQAVAKLINGELDES